MRDLLRTIPALPQRQDSVAEQLADLRAVANRLGMYDAADAIGQIAANPGVLKYGCHCDLDPGAEPDGCVIDDGMLQNCIHAKPQMRKEQCDHWRLIAKT